MKCFPLPVGFEIKPPRQEFGNAGGTRKYHFGQGSAAVLGRSQVGVWHRNLNATEYKPHLNKEQSEVHFKLPDCSLAAASFTHPTSGVRQVGVALKKPFHGPN